MKYELRVERLERNERGYRVYRGSKTGPGSACSQPTPQASAPPPPGHILQIYSACTCIGLCIGHPLQC